MIGTLRRGPVLTVPEVRAERAGDRGHDGVGGDDQPEFTVLVEGGAGEVLRADEDLPVPGAVVGLDHLAASNDTAVIRAWPGSRIRPVLSPACTCGRRDRPGSARRRISRVTGATSPEPHKMKRRKWSGLSSISPG